jgi:hypothetical protein
MHLEMSRDLCFAGSWLPSESHPISEHGANEEWTIGVMAVAQGTSLIDGGDKNSLTLTGGSSLERASRDLGIEGWLHTHAGAWCCVMPNGTADRTQRGGASGGEGRWK